MWLLKVVKRSTLVLKSGLGWENHLCLVQMKVRHSLAIARPSSIIDWAWSGEAAVIFFSIRGVINGLSSNHSVRNCIVLQPIRPTITDDVLWRVTGKHCVKPANSVPGGKASLVIGSSESGSETGREVLLLYSPCCRANSNRRQNGLGV